MFVGIGQDETVEGFTWSGSALKQSITGRKYDLSTNHMAGT